MTDLAPPTADRPAPDEQSVASGGGPAAEGVDDVVVREQTPRRRRPGWFWRFGFPVVMVLLTIGIPVLVYAGRRIILESNDGRLLTEITDPSQPGWEAITEPTPTLLLVQTDEAGTPSSLTVLTLSGEGSGGAVFVPMTTVLEVPGVGAVPLDAAYEYGGIEALQKAVEGVLGTGMQTTVVVGPAEWADLVEPVGPLTVDNPDDVAVPGADGVERVVFPKGEITLAPDEVGTYLATRNSGENDLNRLVRHQAFWESWLAAIAASDDPAAVPGETDSGLGRFVTTLAGDRTSYYPLPVQTAPIPGSTESLYLPVTDQVESLVARLVPFPIGAPPGARLRVRVLDGTGQLDHGLDATPLLVEGGGQIDQIGNATTFDFTTTQIVYNDESRRAEVDRLAEALGVGEVLRTEETGDVVDVTVILGADFVAAPRPEVGTVETLPVQGGSAPAVTGG
ncbi:MAG: LCP family protein [Acidimicrobiales bacterium]|jgi:hypothetical protein|nr:LCP family protein [Acidimicrobiales bacterium]